MAATTTTTAAPKRKLVFDDDGQAREVRALEQLLFGDEGKAAATVLSGPSAAAAAQQRRRRPSGKVEQPASATATAATTTKRSKRASSSDASALAALVARAQEADDDELFAVDRPAGSDDGEDEEGQEEDDQRAAATTTTTKHERRAQAAERARRRQAREQAAAVWHDPDDDNLTVDVSGKSGQPGAARLRKLRTSEAQQTMTGAEYERALRARHALLAGARGSRWATQALAAAEAAREEEEEREEVGAAWSDDDEDDDGEEQAEGARSVADLLRRGDGAARRSSQRGRTPTTPPSAPLPSGNLQVARLRDANASSPQQAVVRSVEWHPNGQLLMTAGMDRTVRLFGVDGRHNPLVQGVHLSDTPVQRAAFAGADGGMVVAAGRRSYYYVVDLHTGTAERVVAPAAVFAEHGRGRGDPGAAALARAAAKARQRGSGAQAKRRAASMAAGAAASASGGPRLKSLETFAVTPPCSSAGGLLQQQPFLNEPLAAFAGDGGHIALVSLRTRQPVAGNLATLKVAAGGAGAVRCLAFAGPDSRQLVASAGDGLVYVWDLRKAGAGAGGGGSGLGGGGFGGGRGFGGGGGDSSNAPLAVFRDEGCVAPSSLAASRDGRWLACGSSAGVVNVYRTQPGLGAVPVGGVAGGSGGGGGGGGGLEAGGAFGGGWPSSSPSSPPPAFGCAVACPSPARSLMNLVTSVDTLTFAPDSQALLAASRLKRDAMRVFHLPSLRAFGNWPTGQTPLGHVHCAGFSPGGGMLAVGNAKGKALLYRLLHYGRV
jgi:U3 small nucleolar RNA-associated protein 18